MPDKHGGSARMLVLGVRDADADAPPVLVVEDLPEGASSAAAEAP
jgi:hypothetical protein